MAVAKMLWASLVLLQLLVDVSAKDCPQGYFGWHCQLECANCEGGKCDQDTGKCSTACKSGYYGHHCLFSNDCMYDSQGIHYTGGKSITDNNTQCVEWSSVVTEGSGIIFENGDEPKNFCRNPLVSKNGRLNKLWCYVSANRDIGICDVNLCGCPANLYGDSCVKQCRCKLPEDVCDHNGVCRNGCGDGWTGIQCQTPCVGSYGMDCSRPCGKCKRNSVCDHETGHCKFGCDPGYRSSSSYPRICDIPCVGSYGMDCSRPCGKCKGNSVCDHKTGHCKFGCDPGYRSSSSYPRICDIQCRFKYGYNCENNCGACYGGEPCDIVTGVCRRGCQDGYTNIGCNSSCLGFYYGKDCAKKCGICKDNSSCDPFTGRCVLGCGDGHIGFECIQQLVIESEIGSFFIWALVAGAVAFAVIILVVVCIVYKKRKRKNLKALNNKSVDQGENTLIVDESGYLLSVSRIASEPPSSARDDDDNYRNNIHEPIYRTIDSRKQISPVPVSELYDYITENTEHACQGFMKEFEELPMGLLALCDVARGQEDKVKNRYGNPGRLTRSINDRRSRMGRSNGARTQLCCKQAQRNHVRKNSVNERRRRRRYGNIVAYDHSRVILDPLPNEPHSDYVNANFMDGYSRPKMYIASQGMKIATVQYFIKLYMS